MHECLCDPGQFGNYFVESDLPFQTSATFFRPEARLKYKTDPDKYQIEGRSIHCRGALFLKSFDINAAGQVHAYLCDLNLLPYGQTSAPISKCGPGPIGSVLNLPTIVGLESIR